MHGRQVTYSKLKDAKMLCSLSSMDYEASLLLSQDANLAAVMPFFNFLFLCV